MIYKEIPETVYCRIGGSGTWGCESPEDSDMGGITLLKRDMESETPFGAITCMKLYGVDAFIMAGRRTRQVLYVPFHDWKGLLPYNDTPSEHIFWTLREAGVKYILADGSGGGINPLLESSNIICPQDLIDYTKHVSYLGKFIPYNIRMREITCPDLHRMLLEKTSGVFHRVFRTGTYGVTETPRFESAAEIQKMYVNHCDVCEQTMMPETTSAKVIGARYATLYIVNDSAEGISPNWERSTFDICSECAPIVGEVMLEAMAAINPRTMNRYCSENIIKMPKTARNRLDMWQVHTGEETIMKHLKLFTALALIATITALLAGCQDKTVSSPDIGAQTVAGSGEANFGGSASKGVDTETSAGGQTVSNGSSEPFKVTLMIGIDGPKDGELNNSILVDVEVAETNHGVECRLVEPKEISGFEANFTGLFVPGKYDLIIGGDSDAVKTLQKVASRLPEWRYLFIDGGVTGCNNVTSVLFRDNEKAYLVGTVTGLNTKINKIGMVVSVDNPSQNILMVGYMAGAKAASPDMEAIARYVSSLTDTITAKELALVGADADADVISTAAGSSGLGVFNAVQQGTFEAVDANVDQCLIDPNHIMLSAIRKTDVVIKDGIKPAIDGTPEDGTMVPGLKEDVLDIISEGSRVEIDPTSLDAAQTAKDKITFDEITVPLAIDKAK